MANAEPKCVIGYLLLVCENFLNPKKGITIIPKQFWQKLNNFFLFCQIFEKNSYYFCQKNNKTKNLHDFTEKVLAYLLVHFAFFVFLFFFFWPIVNQHPPVYP
jgi:hypothetical protein